MSANPQLGFEPPQSKSSMRVVTPSVMQNSAPDLCYFHASPIPFFHLPHTNNITDFLHLIRFSDLILCCLCWWWGRHQSDTKGIQIAWNHLFGKYSCNQSWYFYKLLIGLFYSRTPLTHRKFYTSAGNVKWKPMEVKWLQVLLNVKVKHIGAILYTQQANTERII